MNRATLQTIATILAILWFMSGLWRAYIGLLYYRLRGDTFFSSKRMSLKAINKAIADEKDDNIYSQLLSVKKQYRIYLFLFYSNLLLYLSLILLPAFHIIVIH